MAYTISYFLDDTVTTERWIGKLEEVAQAVAARTVTSKGADHVEIRNERGELVFQCPRVMHRV